MKASTEPGGRHGSGLVNRTVIKAALGACAVLFTVLLGGWLWTVRGHSDPTQALRASELREDLLGAHNSVLGAYVRMYERDFFSASRQLEDARDRLRRANDRGRRLGLPADVMRLDLARFEADIDEAQQLLGQLDLQTSALAPNDKDVVEVVPGSSTFRQR